MRVMLAAVPGSDWMCEECMVSFGYKKSECETEGVCSTSHLPAKRPGAPLQASSVKKSWVGVRAIPPRSSKPCYRSCKNFKNGKVKATKSFTFELQMSCNSQEKAKAPRACVDKGKKHILEAGSGKKTRVLETKVTFPEASKPSNRSLLRRGHPFQNSGKAKLEAAHSVSFVKQSSSGFQEKPRLPKLHSQTKIARDKCSLLKLGSSKTGDLKVKEGMAKGGCFEKQKIERYVASDEIRKGKNARVVFKAVLSNSVSSEKLHATCSEVILEKAYRPVVFKNSNSSEQTNTARKKCVSKLDNPAMCFPASDPDATAARSGNKTIFPDETFSGPNCSRLDAVHSSGRIETGLQLNSHNTEKDQNCLHEETANEIQQAGRPAEAATAMKVHKLSTGLGSDERSQFAAATLPQNIVIPESDRIWLGNFQIQRSEGIPFIYDGLQANLSTRASQKVLEVVDKLPEIVVLEELPRMRLWPSQFMERQATEENIALYFFARDLISYERYEKLMEHMTKNDLALKGNLDGVELLIFPSNVLPEESQRWNNLLFFWGVFRGRKVKNSANTPESSSQKIESGDNVSSRPLDLNAYPDDAIKDDNVQGKLPIEEKNNADCVEVLGKLPMNMEGENGDDNVDTSRSSFLSHASPTNNEEDVDLLALQAAETLVLLSGGLGKEALDGTKDHRLRL